jgi:predicted CXXCH cytochrome family protein
MFLIALAALLLVFVLPAYAHAYDDWATAPDPWTWANCDTCHAPTGAGGSETWDGAGPHSGYVSTSNKCKLCHAVHNAPAGSVLLLRGPTVAQTCLLCHDGTATRTYGPYRSLEAHGGAVVSEHSYEITGIVPGGTNNLDHDLYCSDCHSVHGANTVTPFITDSTRAWDLGLDETDNLLRRDVNGQTVAEYGAQWCAACHDLRHSTNTGSIRNHPVNDDSAWGYGDVVTTVSAASLRYENNGTDSAIGMGQTNAPYIMGPVPPSGDGHVTEANRRRPMCQQCHEDSRDVEEIYAADVFSPNTSPYLNPAFLTFPHQATSRYFLVEENDDLCLNCHTVPD